MNKIIPAILVLAITSLLYFSTGCKKDENTTNEFVIQIDSLRMPDTIAFGSQLDIKFYGLIGTNDCYDFKEFEEVAPNVGDPQNSIKIKTWGIYQDSGNCQAQTVYMNPATLQLTGMAAGTFRVNAIQPNGTIMTATTYVKE